MAVEWGDKIPQRYLKARPEDLPDSLRDWDWSSGLGPYLVGPKGVGKTYAAAAMAMSSGVHPYFVEWVSTVRLFADMRRKMNDPTVKLPCLDKAKLVVLDDLGRERPSGWVIEQMFTLVDDLYCRETALIVTSNTADLQAHLGEYTWDRFADMLKSVPMEGESRRGR